jgi:hypothetical protein
LIAVSGSSAASQRRAASASAVQAGITRAEQPSGRRRERRSSLSGVHFRNASSRVSRRRQSCWAGMCARSLPGRRLRV